MINNLFQIADYRKVDKKPIAVQNIFNAFRAVERMPVRNEYESQYQCLLYAVKEMRALQTKREKDLSPSVWEMARTMERQVDAMIGGRYVLNT